MRAVRTRAHLQKTLTEECSVRVFCKIRPLVANFSHRLNVSESFLQMRGQIRRLRQMVRAIPAAARTTTAPATPKTAAPVSEMTAPGFLPSAETFTRAVAGPRSGDESHPGPRWRWRSPWRAPSSLGPAHWRRPSTNRRCNRPGSASRLRPWQWRLRAA